MSLILLFNTKNSISGGWNTKGILNSNGTLCSVFQWHWVFQWSSILNKMAAILSKTIGNQNKVAAILFGYPLVRFLNVRDHSYRYCCDWPFQNQTIGNLNFKTFGIPMCSVFQCVRYSNVFCIQALTVVMGPRSTYCSFFTGPVINAPSKMLN